MTSPKNPDSDLVTLMSFFIVTRFADTCRYHTYSSTLCHSKTENYFNPF